MSSAAQEAAAGLVTDIVADIALNGAPGLDSETRQHYVDGLRQSGVEIPDEATSRFPAGSSGTTAEDQPGLAEKLFGASVVEGPITATAAATAPEPEPEPVPELVSAAAELGFDEEELPDEVKAILEDDDGFDDDDDEEEERLPPAAVRHPEDEWEEEADPEKARLARENEKLRRKIEHQEKIARQRELKNWKAESKKLFKLITDEQLDEIGKSASSRRAFLRKAKATADSNKKLVAPFVEAAKSVVNERGVEIEAEKRQEAVKAWGKPTTGPSGVPSEAGVRQERLQRARRSGDFTEAVKALVGL